MSMELGTMDLGTTSRKQKFEFRHVQYMTAKQQYLTHCRLISSFTRQHTDARYWYSKSVRPSPFRSSVCPLRSGIEWKRLNNVS